MLLSEWLVGRAMGESMRIKASGGLRAALAGALMMVAAWPAAAEVVWTSPQIGAWRVYADRGRGGTTCFMTSIAGGSGVLYAITPGPKQVLAMRHDKWNIPAGATARIQMQIDRRSLWTVNVRRATDRSDTIVMETDFDESSLRFLHEFREGNVLNIAFPNGDRYQINLTGTRASTDYLIHCNRAYVQGESGLRDAMGN
jgi:hypothetical protein